LAGACHRGRSDLQAAGIQLLTDTPATAVKPQTHQLTIQPAGQGPQRHLYYDRLIVGTGAVPQQPPIAGLDVDRFLTRRGARIARPAAMTGRFRRPLTVSWTCMGRCFACRGSW
jgi:NADPH-dependent 2,4-dienoyl-CoA reductase/sulfur reductase-like enzyme